MATGIIITSHFPHHCPSLISLMVSVDIKHYERRYYFFSCILYNGVIMMTCVSANSPAQGSRDGVVSGGSEYGSGVHELDRL